ncbi:ribosomal protein S7 [Aureobasidium pullulans]|uniref:Small ribosomal subunit protein uS7m n=1 Tax=Aureobasidium pullulans TaxID=5580 RepID=A0A4S9XWB1_AURPU|nr:ribosomal protein S7 [Aureobasidium pullulans]
MSLFATSRALAFHPRAIASIQSPIAASWRRNYATDPKQSGGAGPNMHQQEHISEEAAKMAKIQGGQGPDLEMGTPVQELLEEDKEAQKNAPQVLKDSIKAGAQHPKPSQTRSFSTSARSRQEELSASNESPFDEAIVANTNFGASELAVPATPVTTTPTGHKFGLPTLPLPSNAHKDYRYDPVVRQFTNLMMQHGKLSVAQRNMSTILTHLRTQSPPNYNPSRPLLPGAPPPSHLPLNPVLYLTLAVDSIAPLLRIRSQRGAAGGGVALQIPVPLGLRQRRRTAFEWILDAASKRKSRGSGRDMFALRVAEEIVAIIEGRSSAWEKRTGIHKIATTARSNLTFGKTGLRR